MTTSLSMPSESNDDAWVIPPASAGDIRLFCMPPAGAGASSYRKWPTALPRHVGVHRVQPPGREGRLRETRCSQISQYVDVLCRLIGRDLTRPYALFGHSMGALVAFEVAHAMRERTGVEPKHLFVSAYRSPDSPKPAPIHDLPDTLFIEQLRLRYDGVPNEVLRHPEILELMLPIVRADLKILHDYEYRARPPLTCPVTAFGGRSDPWVSEEQLASWRPVTSNGFELHMFNGGHFYLDAELTNVAGIIARTLGSADNT